MRNIKFSSLFFRAILHPYQFIRFLRLPRSYSSLDEWLSIDREKCDIMAKIIKCNNVDSLKQQQSDNMDYRKSVTGSFTEWIKKYSRQKEHSEAIDRIGQKYADRKICHRDYKNHKVVCYCRKRHTRKRRNKK